MTDAPAAHVSKTFKNCGKVAVFCCHFMYCYFQDKFGEINCLDFAARASAALTRRWRSKRACDSLTVPKRAMRRWRKGTAHCKRFTRVLFAESMQIAMQIQLGEALHLDWDNSCSSALGGSLPGRVVCRPWAMHAWLLSHPQSCMTTWIMESIYAYPRSQHGPQIGNPDSFLVYGCKKHQAIIPYNKQWNAFEFWVLNRLSECLFRKLPSTWWNIGTRSLRTGQREESAHLHALLPQILHVVQSVQSLILPVVYDWKLFGC